MKTAIDLIIRIKNAYLSRAKTTEAPFSKIGEEVVKILTANGFIDGYQKKEDKPFNKLFITLKYARKQPAIKEIKIITKPGLKVYSDYKNLNSYYKSNSVCLVSTSKGLLIGKEAHKQHIGGEVICQIW